MVALLILLSAKVQSLETLDLELGLTIRLKETIFCIRPIYTIPIIWKSSDQIRHHIFKRRNSYLVIFRVNIMSTTMITSTVAFEVW